jgi:hypothetical protein
MTEAVRAYASIPIGFTWWGRGTPKTKEAPGFPGASSFFLTLSRESNSVLRLNSDIVEEGTHERAKDE